MKANTPELMKFKRLQRKLGESRRGIIGLLEAMWIEVSRNCPEGDIGRFTDEEIAIMVDWEGDPALLVESLVECRWLDRCEENRLVVHDWADHCPTYVRGGLAKRGKVIAKASTSEVQAESAEVVAKAKSLEVASTKPIQAKPIQAKPIQAKPIQDICSELASQTHEQEPSKCQFPVFPTSGKAKTWQASQEQLDEWSKCYPIVDIESEHRRAHAWIMANLTKRKTQKGMAKFLNSWFARQQDRGGSVTKIPELAGSRVATASDFGTGGYRPS